MGRLERKLDLELIAKIQAGWKPEGRTLSTRSKIRGATTYQPAREGKTYRAARRNATIHKKSIERHEELKKHRKWEVKTRKDLNDVMAKGEREFYRAHGVKPPKRSTLARIKRSVERFLGIRQRPMGRRCA